VYKSTFNIENIFYAIVVNNYYYFTQRFGSGIIKTSLTLSTPIKSFGNPDSYRNLYYDSRGSRIMACQYGRVNIFDLDLNLMNTILIPGENPSGFVIYNFKFYVASYQTGNVVVISNNLIESSKPSQCSSGLGGISVDPFGYFALICHLYGKVYIYDSSMSYTNKSIDYALVLDARLDINNNLAICGGSNVTIYS
jgi:hypothetical protein